MLRCRRLRDRIEKRRDDELRHYPLEHRLRRRVKENVSAVIVLHLSVLQVLDRQREQLYHDRLLHRGIDIVREDHINLVQPPLAVFLKNRVGYHPHRVKRGLLHDPAPDIIRLLAVPPEILLAHYTEDGNATVRGSVLFQLFLREGEKRGMIAPAKPLVAGNDDEKRVFCLGMTVEIRMMNRLSGMQEYVLHRRAEPDHESHVVIDHPDGLFHPRGRKQVHGICDLPRLLYRPYMLLYLRRVKQVRPTFQSEASASRP